MRRFEFGCAALSLVTVGLLVAGPAQSRPVSVRGPDPSSLQAYYPEAALAGGISGAVVVECTLLANGRVTDCRAVRENPVGWGFAAAAVRAAEETFRLRPQAGETPVARSRIRFPMRFRTSRARILRDSFEAPTRPKFR